MMVWCGRETLGVDERSGQMLLLDDVAVVVVEG